MEGGEPSSVAGETGRDEVFVSDFDVSERKGGGVAVACSKGAVGCGCSTTDVLRRFLVLVVKVGDCVVPRSRSIRPRCMAGEQCR